MRRIIISAMSRDHIIGSGEGMPWQVPEEYAHFVRSVAGNTMVMGRRSWEIFGADVETAHNLVISRGGPFPGAETVDSLAAALIRADGYGRPIFIAGGGSIYRQALEQKLVDEMYLSYIKGDFTGDTRFPEFDAADWQVVEEIDHDAWTFVHYLRSPGV